MVGCGKGDAPRKLRATSASLVLNLHSECAKDTVQLLCFGPYNPTGSDDGAGATLLRLAAACRFVSSLLSALTCSESTESTACA
jgi:hypothetical protein